MSPLGTGSLGRGLGFGVVEMTSDLARLSTREVPMEAHVQKLSRET